MPVDFSHLLNPYAPGFKKFIFQLVDNQTFIDHQNIIDQLAKNITNEREYKMYGDFFMAIWHAGFVKSIEQNAEGLKKIGLKAMVVYPEKSG